MQVIDKIRENYNLLKGFARNGVGTRWFVHVEMYDDYTRLCREGHKQAFIVAYLCEIYHLSERHFYRIIGQLKDVWRE